MAIRIRLYEQPGLNRLDLTTYYRERSLSVTYNAEEGSVALGTLILDDPTGVLDIPPLHRIDVWDDEAPVGNQLIFAGATVGRELERGANPVGPGRQWLITLEDRNTLLHRRLLIGNDANRPAETDVARIQWLLSTDEIGVNVANPTYVNTSNPVPMDPADYRGQYVYAVLDDCQQQSGKHGWIMSLDGTTAAITSSSTGNPTTITTATPHYLGSFPAWVRISGHSSTPDINGEWVATPVTDTTFTIGVNVTSGGSGGSMIADTVGLWYDRSTSAAYASTHKISNVAADVDGVTIHAPALDSRLRLDPSRIYTGVNVAYQGGSVYQTDSALQIEYIDRDAVSPAVNVSTAAKATARGLQYLANNRTDEEVVTTAVLLGHSNINAIRTGHLIDAKFSHFPGWEDYRKARILNRTVSQETVHLYRVDMEMVGHAPSSGLIVAAFMSSRFGRQPTWQGDWTQIAYIEGPGGAPLYSEQFIDMRVGTERSCTVTNAVTLGNGYSLTLVELENVGAFEDVDTLESVGPTITMPTVTAASNAAIVAFHHRITSAEPRNTPSGYTQQHTSWVSNHDRNLIATFTRIVSAGNYGGSFTGGGEEANRAYVATGVFPAVGGTPTVVGVASSGVLTGGGKTLTVNL